MVITVDQIVATLVIWWVLTGLGLLSLSVYTCMEYTPLTELVKDRRRLGRLAVITFITALLIVFWLTPLFAA